jgi:small-conductance mechanosensitive channel
MLKWMRYGILSVFIGFLSYSSYAQTAANGNDSIISVQSQEDYSQSASALGIGQKFVITDDLWNLDDNITKFKTNLDEQNIHSNAELFQMGTYLEKQSHALEQCVHLEDIQLQYLQDSLSYMKNLKNDKQLTMQYEKLLKTYQIHYEKKSFCALLQFRLHRMQLDLNNQLFSNTIEYFKHQTSFFPSVIYRITEQHDWEFVKKSLALYSNFGFYVPNQLWVACLFILLFWGLNYIYNFIRHLFRNYFKFKMNYEFDIKIEHLEYRFLYFMLINPFVYGLIRNGFTHTVNVLDRILSLNVFNLLFLVNFIYILFMLKVEMDRKAFGKLLLIVVNLCLVIYLLMNTNYKVLYNQMDIALTTSYYLLFVAIQSFVVLIVTWIFYPFSKNIHHYLMPIIRPLFVFVLVCNGLLGIMGYINFSITFDVNLVLTVIFLMWTYIFHQIWGYLFDIMVDDNHRIGRKVLKWTNVKTGQPIIELSIIKYLVLFGVYARTFFAIAGLWFLSPSAYENMHQILWSTHTLFGMPIVPMQILEAIMFFIVMIFFSRIASKILAYRIFQVEDDVEKFERVMFIAGAIFSTFCSLSIAGVNLANFAIVMGGLTVGIGIGLKNLLNNFISGLLLMVYHPISVGDYVSVGNMKGYVKKIRLMGSQIETNDRSTVMVPNNVILSSIIENYTYNKNYIHNVHFKFSFMSLYDYEPAKKIIMDELTHHKEILTDELHKPIILFTPRNESNIAFDVEVICTPKNLHVRDQVISDLNLRILNAFITAKLHVALGQTPFDKPEQSTS